MSPNLLPVSLNLLYFSKILLHRILFSYAFDTMQSLLRVRRIFSFEVRCFSIRYEKGTHYISSVVRLVGVVGRANLYARMRLSFKNVFSLRDENLWFLVIFCSCCVAPSTWHLVILWTSTTLEHRIRPNVW